MAGAVFDRVGDGVVDAPVQIQPLVLSLVGGETGSVDGPYDVLAP
jgi:hypothetical protein